MALSELGNISLVAERLHLSAPAIHKQLKTLEGELGLKLYERAGQQLRITQATEVLLPYLQDMLVQYDSAVLAIEGWKGLKHGSVRIGAGPSGCVLPSIIRAFELQFPEIELQVESGNTGALVADLEKGLLDLALIVSSDLRECDRFLLEAVWSVDLVLVSTPEAAPAACQLADLREESFILFRKGSRLQDPIDRYFSENDFVPKAVMRFDNANSIREMVLSGRGIAFLPRWVVGRELRAGQLCAIELEGGIPTCKLALIRRKTTSVLPAVKSFIEVTRNSYIEDCPQMPPRKRPAQLRPA